MGKGGVEYPMCYSWSWRLPQVSRLLWAARGGGSSRRKKGKALGMEVWKRRSPQEVPLLGPFLKLTPCCSVQKLKIGLKIGTLTFFQFSLHASFMQKIPKWNNDMRFTEIFVLFLIAMGINFLLYTNYDLRKIVWIF